MCLIDCAWLQYANHFVHNPTGHFLQGRLVMSFIARSVVAELHLGEGRLYYVLSIVLNNSRHVISTAITHSIVGCPKLKCL